MYNKFKKQFFVWLWVFFSARFVDNGCKDVYGKIYLQNSSRKDWYSHELDCKEKKSRILFTLNLTNGNYYHEMMMVKYSVFFLYQVTNKANINGQWSNIQGCWPIGLIEFCWICLNKIQGDNSRKIAFMVPERYYLKWPI